MKTSRTCVVLAASAGIAFNMNPARAQTEPVVEPAATASPLPGEVSAPPPVPEKPRSNLGFLGRVYVLTGLYDVKSTRDVTNNFDPEIATRFDSDTGMVGGGFTGAISAAGFVGDLGLEYTDIDRFSVTEAVLRVSRKLTRNFGVAVGYRVAQQGDGFANDDIYQEAGYLVGVTFGPVAIPFASLDRLQLTAGLAYNGSQIDLKSTSGDKPNADGLTASVRLLDWRSPWSVLLRYRRFEFDTTTRSGAAVVREDLTEQYLSFAVEYRIQR